MFRIPQALKAQPAAALIQDSEKVRKQYKYWRLRIMYASFIGYAVFYFCRKNLSAATPALLTGLDYSKTQVGTLWSALYLTYGVSKLVNGMLGDKANPRYFMAIGLFLSAITNLFFGMSSSLTVLLIFWALNGWFQGMGWPASVRMLTHWFSKNERGTTWGVWNTSHQVGGGFILILGGFLAEHYGWRYSFIIPAGIGIVCALFLLNRLRDTPESMGLPAIEVYRNDIDENTTNNANQKDLSMKQILFEHVLNNKQLWLLSFGNFFIYLVRYGAMDWAPTFLVEVKHSSLTNASLKTAGFELIGILGAFLAGWASDKFFKGKRSPVNLLYTALLAFAVLEFWMIPPGYPVLDACALAAVGFLVYGPQMLVGVAAADIASKHAAGTATGLTGFFGYMGSIVSGIGTGFIVDKYGWDGGFLFFFISAVLGVLCFIGTWFGDRGHKKTNNSDGSVVLTSQFGSVQRT